MQISSRILVFALMGVTVLNMKFILYLLNALEALLPTEHQYTYVEDDFPSQLPLRLPSVGLVLANGAPHFSLYADDDWGTLFPESDGFTDLGPKNRTFLISFVHQLHCLDVFRVGFVTNRTGFAHHVEHCLRYMRQAVLCYADTTLEVDHPGLLDG
ncbi:hypothetical protein K466DRAFT_275261 [Polyporus arcularius HHB13444]|uniref:Uncharacterized protein n=1 Tax=Polyporus arcularius HHB13444 TaxID=1314778 RepID=A0A5C3PB67_9APHY|nr:hypothetical protein K466DRAFT_275261 [Polyporus arcularius HHB13444]